MKASIIILLLSALSFRNSINLSTITVNITNIKVMNGNIVISLFNNAADFPSEGKEFQKAIIPVTSKQIRYTFINIPLGDYAIAAFHDKNSDCKCNVNFLGIPQEGYCFSQNVKPVLSAPSFEDVKFKISTHQLVNFELCLIN